MGCHVALETTRIHPKEKHRRLLEGRGVACAGLEGHCVWVRGQAAKGTQASNLKRALHGITLSSNR